MFVKNFFKLILFLQLHEEYTLAEVTLERQALGFGFRIVGGTEEGSQVTVGHIVPGGSADCDPRIQSGDEILSIDGVNVVSILNYNNKNTFLCFFFYLISNEGKCITSSCCAIDG